MRYIILISGYSSSGKDSFADRFISTFKGKSRKLAFADTLKIHTARKYNFDIALTKSQEGKSTYVFTPHGWNNTNVTVRNLLISESKLLKKENINVFAKMVYTNIINADTIHGKEHVVISDFRFPNEYAYLYKCFASRPNNKLISIRVNRFDKSPVDSDTETQLDDFEFDYYIDNKDTLANFIEKIDGFARFLSES